MSRRKRARKGGELTPAENAVALNQAVSRYVKVGDRATLAKDVSLLELQALLLEADSLCNDGVAPAVFRPLLQLYVACGAELTEGLDLACVQFVYKIADQLCAVNPEDVSHLETKADIAADLANANQPVDPAKADHVFALAIQTYKACYDKAGTDAQRALYAESYVNLVDQYMRFRLRSHMDHYVSDMPAASLLTILQQAFSWYPSLMASEKARARKWLSMMQTDWQNLCQMAMHLSLINSAELTSNQVRDLIAPVQKQLLELQAKRINQYDLSAPYKERLAELERYQVAKPAVPLFLALPTAAMIAAPSHGFLGASRLQLSGDGASRIAWMCDGVCRALADDAVRSQVKVVDSAGVTVEHARALLENLYAADELDFLQAASRLSEKTGIFYALDASDTFVNAASFQAVLACMSNIHALTEAVLATPAEQSTSALAIQRPPNHHAGACRLKSALPEQQPGTGFCIANAMLAEAIERAKSGIKVLIVDIDVHSGNGTQNLLIQTVKRLSLSHKKSDRDMAQLLRDNIRFINTFEKSNYPFNATAYEESDDHASCAEYADIICNMPYKDGMRGEEAVAAVHASVTEQIEAGFMPDITFCSYGMDAYKDDALSKAKFGHADYRALLQSLPGKLVVLPEGGYHKHGVEGALQVAAEVCAQRSRVHLEARTVAHAGVGKAVPQSPLGEEESKSTKPQGKRL